MTFIKGDWKRRFFFAVRECIGGSFALTTQNYTELNVKKGQQFFFVDVTLGIPGDGGTKEYLVRTTEPVILKQRIYKTNTNDVDYEVFVGGTLNITDPGTPAIIRNANGVNPNTTNLQGFEDPVYTGEGFLIDLDWIPGSFEAGNRTNGGFSTEGYEKIIPGNTDLLIRFTNNSIDTLKLYYYLTWYEGPIVPMGDDDMPVPTTED